MRALAAIALSVSLTSFAEDDTPAYSVQPYLRQRFDDVGKQLRFQGTTAAEAAPWRAASREKLERILGIDTMTSCDLGPKVTERVDCGDYTRERVELQTEPGIVMPVYVLIPKTGKAPFPVVICPHGHSGGGKAAVAGVTAEPKIAEAIKSYNYDYGVAFCRAGCVVLCPDARGFGERQEKAAKSNPLNSSCQWINQMALPLGQTVTGMWVWDLKRAADYIATRDDCDASRIGCAGLSGGGLQTLWFTALDDRVEAAVVSGYFYGVKESLLDMHTNCSCNYVPHLWENADHGDLGSLVAPRPLMIQTGDEDNLNGASNLDNVKPQIAIARRAYDVLSASANLRHDIFHGPHRWDSTNAVPWLVDELNK